jgi:hypothetical protein
VLLTVMLLPIFSTFLKICGNGRLSLNLTLGASDHPSCRDPPTATIQPDVAQKLRHDI